MTPRKFMALSAFLILLILTASCQKTYTISPLTASSAATPTATTTINVCATLTPVAVPPSGIYWNPGTMAEGLLNYGGTTYPVFEASLYLLVNGNPETTAGVTLLIEGVSYAILAYTSTNNINGVNYAYYYVSQTTEASSSGLNWTLLSATSAGTASATLVMPGPLNAATDGSAVSWTLSGMSNLVQVTNNSSGVTTFTTPLCGSANSPVSIPASAYPASGTYTLDADCLNLTTSISGGQGLLEVGNVISDSITK